MQIACFDFEGVLVPKIWIEASKRSSIPELSRTMRDEPDYDKLTRFRIDLLERRGLAPPGIQAVIADVCPLSGAAQFIHWLRERFQGVILSERLADRSNVDGLSPSA